MQGWAYAVDCDVVPAARLRCDRSKACLADDRRRGMHTCLIVKRSDFEVVTAAK
eukprot:SAG11_NODE_1041_length_6056_cov_5.902468_5_plen_54_part_00